MGIVVPVQPSTKAPVTSYFVAVAPCVHPMFMIAFFLFVIERRLKLRKLSLSLLQSCLELGISLFERLVLEHE